MPLARATGESSNDISMCRRVAGNGSKVLTPRYAPDRQPPPVPSALSLDACRHLLDGAELPLDWELTTIQGLTESLKARGLTVQEAMKAIDADQDGRISFDELRAWLGRMGAGLSARQVALILAAIDLNGDNELDRAELVAAFQDAGASAALSPSSQPSRAALGARREPRGAGPQPPRELRWDRLRRLRISRLLTATFPDCSSAFKAFLHPGDRGISVSGWEAGLQRLFRAAKVAVPSPRQARLIFDAVAKDRDARAPPYATMSPAEFESAFWRPGESQHASVSEEQIRQPPSIRRQATVQPARGGRGGREAWGAVQRSVDGLDGPGAGSIPGSLLSVGEA